MSRVIPLTNTQIKNAKPTIENGNPKGYKLPDGDGMQLKIANNGTKSFVLNYRCPVTEKHTSLSFGVYPAVSLAEARTLRREARALISKGINPKIHKENQIKPTEACSTYIIGN